MRSSRRFGPRWNGLLRLHSPRCYPALRGNREAAPVPGEAQPRNGSTRTWDIALTTSDLAVKCNVMHQPRTSLMAAAVKLASSSVSDSVMIRGGPSSTMSPSRPSAHPVEE